MSVIKCKMCGGDLNIQDGKTVAEWSISDSLNIVIL